MIDTRGDRVNGAVGVKCALLAGLTMVFASVLPAGSASATTTAQCTPAFHYNASGSAIGAGEYCVDTTRQYRAKVECLDPLRGSTLYAYGPYVNPGVWSRKDCPFQGGVQFLAQSVSAQPR
jgi:hypothetical protein